MPSICPRLVLRNWMCEQSHGLRPQGEAHGPPRSRGAEGGGVNNSMAVIASVSRTAIIKCHLLGISVLGFNTNYIL